MACERYRGALADVGAGAPASTEFEAHLADCPACRAELEAVQRALALADEGLRDLLAAEAGPALRARIRKAVGEDAERGRGRRRFFWTWATAPAIGAALLVLAAIVTWRQARITQLPAGPSVVQSQGQPTGVDMSRAVETTPPALPTPMARASSSADTSTGRHSVVDSATRAARARPSTALPRAASAEPAVLIPPGEADALLRFALELQHRQIEPDSLLVADLAAPLPEPKPIEIAPLDIVPLDPSGTF